MKDSKLYFIMKITNILIGLLLGIVLTAAAFFWFCIKNNMADRKVVNNLCARVIEQKLNEKYNDRFNVYSLDIEREMAEGIASDGTNSFKVSYNTRRNILADEYEEILELNKSQQKLKERIEKYGEWQGSSVETECVDDIPNRCKISLSISDINKLYALYKANDDLAYQDIWYIAHIGDQEINIKQSQHLTLAQMKELLE